MPYDVLCYEVLHLRSILSSPVYL